MSNDPAAPDDTTPDAPTVHPDLIARHDVRYEPSEHMKVARSYTRFVWTTGPSGGEGVGAADAFRLGGRLFLVTAGHLLGGTLIVWLITGSVRGLRAEVLNRHMHPESPDE